MEIIVDGFEKFFRRSEVLLIEFELMELPVKAKKSLILDYLTFKDLLEVIVVIGSSETKLKLIVLVEITAKIQYGM